jgi:hypothetical protein
MKFDKITKMLCRAMLTASKGFLINKTYKQKLKPYVFRYPAQHVFEHINIPR